MKQIKIYQIASLALILIVVATACSTKKNTLISRNYHNLTAHYNIYFNGYEIYTEGLKKIETSYQEDFNKILPLDIYTKKEVARRLLPDMDKTVKKCSKVITMHSITSKPKRKSRGKQSDRQKEFYKQNEFNKWIDDSYFLMGKAYYLKHDNFAAIQNFEYVIRQFPNEGLKNDASLWLAKTHIALKDYRAAKDLLDRLEGDAELPDRIRPEIAAVRANYHMEQEEFSDAMNYLVEAISLTKNKSDLIRFNYIAAQLLEKEGELANASLKYEDVIKLNPDYRMAFNAKINRARLYEGDADTGQEIRKQLAKMLKDDKNIEFLDQIYYALAELDIKEDLVDSAIENYKLSAQSTIDNLYQQTLSYKALGELYYSRPEYIKAQVYYDSCLMVLPEDFPDRDNVEKFGLSLNALGQNLSMVKREDSLQSVAALSEEERDVLIKIKIDEAKRIAEEQQRLEEEERMNGRQGGFRMAGGQGGPGGSRSLPGNPGSMNQGGGSRVSGMGGGMSSQMGGSGGSKWYFYNPSTLSYGQAEFSKRFGRRKLEDNWRRKNKGISSAMGDMSTEGEEGDIQTQAMKSNADKYQNTTREYYLADLPLNDTLLKESNDRIAVALFNVGKVFKDELNKEQEAIEYFELLLQRYPETDKLLFAYYNLYQVFKETEQSDKLVYYKSLILNRFPDSRSAKIISNPNFFQEIEEARIEIMAFYKETYLLYEKEDYEMVISNCVKADTAFALNPIRDKFSLLQVLSIGALDPENKLVLANQINDLLFKYPESEVTETARTLLKILESGPESIGLANTTPGGLSIGKVDPAAEEEVMQDFQFQEDAVHYYIAVVSRRTQDLNRLTFNISNFNVENFDQDYFEVSSVPMNDDLMLIIVKNFADETVGMNYYYSLLADPQAFADFDQTDFRHFIISRANYNIFYKNQNVFKYIQFFKANYLDEEN
ncbi:MAG: tetratricopeptide repeat protein [Bacteroidetes bacterium]|nr:tetratricopeptide repeat protein [Bacteroidota bacterium]MBT7091865.1 tetratricopeptide repeat protein [Bacteroidota bacterium]